MSHFLSAPASNHRFRENPRGSAKKTVQKRASFGFPFLGVADFAEEAPKIMGLSTFRRFL
jgi:hypothetical protein